MRSKIMLSPSFVRSEIVEKRKSLKQLCREHGIGEKALKRFVVMNGIDKEMAVPRQTELRDVILTREFLYEEIIVKGKTRKQLAVELGIDKKSVYKYAKSHGISGMLPTIPSQKLTHAILHELYVVQKLSTGDIAAALGIASRSSVLRELKRVGIKTSRKQQPSYMGICSAFWGHIYRGAQGRQWHFDVSIEYAWSLWESQGGKCALTGVPLSLPTKENYHTDASQRTASFDRIDSTLGYVVGNVQWIHKIVNIMKGNLSEREFLDWCKLVVIHGRII